MSRPKKYPDELIQRGIRLALESERPIAHIAADLGTHPETLRKRVRQHEADSGTRPDLPTSAEREEIRRLRAESNSPTSGHGTGPPRLFFCQGDRACCWPSPRSYERRLGCSVRGRAPGPGVASRSWSSTVCPCSHTSAIPTAAPHSR